MAASLSAITQTSPSKINPPQPQKGVFVAVYTGGSFPIPVITNLKWWNATPPGTSIGSSGLGTSHQTVQPEATQQTPVVKKTRKRKLTDSKSGNIWQQPLNSSNAAASSSQPANTKIVLQTAARSKKDRMQRVQDVFKLINKKSFEDNCYKFSEADKLMLSAHIGKKGYPEQSKLGVFNTIENDARHFLLAEKCIKTGHSCISVATESGYADESGSVFGWKFDIQNPPNN